MAPYLFPVKPVAFPPRPLLSRTPQVSAGAALTRHVVGTHGNAVLVGHVVYDDIQQLVMAIKKHKLTS